MAKMYVCVRAHAHKTCKNIGSSKEEKKLPMKFTVQLSGLDMSSALFRNKKENETGRSSWIGIEKESDPG